MGRAPGALVGVSGIGNVWAGGRGSPGDHGENWADDDVKLRRGSGDEGSVASEQTHDELDPPEHELALSAKLTHGGQRLGDLLKSRGLVTAQQISAALETQERAGGVPRLGAILIEQDAVDERQISEALAEQYNLKVVDLRSVTPTPAALARLDAETARRLRALPIRVGDRGVVVALDEAPDTDTLRTLVRAVGGDLGIVLTPPSELTRALNRTYKATADVDRLVAAFELGGGRPAGGAAAAEVSFDENAPIVQVVSRLITEAVRERASDLHLEPQADGLRVRYRIDGALHEPLRLPVSMAQPLVSRIKIMAGMNIVERRRAQDGQFEFEADNRALDIRVATIPTIWGEKVVLRLLDRSRSLLELPELGMPPSTAHNFSRLIRSPFGMVICAGPTGSGKTTTLYAALNEMNDPERNITTIEDPVEYVFPDINQIQINEAADVTFAGGLKAILRQDPDIILVGEMRDVETTRIAVQSALTGHFVLSSLHATDAVAALHRLLDMGIESFLIASSVIAIVGQRLVRRICPHCAVVYTPTPDEIAFFEDAGGEAKHEFWKGEGCNHCSHTGYSDRIGVFELLQVTDEIKDLIVESAPHEKLLAVAAEQGMRTMRDEAVGLVTQDVTTISEALRRIYAT